MTSTPTYEVDFGEAPSELIDSLLDSALLKAGLRGAYRIAESDYGKRVISLVESGKGAYLFGKPGRGKTYAAAHAVRVAVERGFSSGKARGQAMLVTAKVLLDDIRDGYSGNGTGMFARAESVPLLALDDFGAERMNDWSIETLTRLIDTRTNAGLPTVYTSNYPLGKLRDVWGEIPGARMASRIEGSCERIEVTGPDRRLA